MSSVRRKPFLFFVLLVLSLLAATALAAERGPARPAAGLTPRYGVAAEMELRGEVIPPQVVDPDTGRIYAAADDSQRLSIIETRPALEESPYTLPFRLAQLALSPDGGRLYFLEEPAAGAHQGRVVVLDTATFMTTGNFTFACPAEAGWLCVPQAAAVGPDNRLYVVMNDGAVIDIRDGDSGALLLRFAHPGGPLLGFAVQGAALYTTYDDDANDQAILRRFDISALTPVAGPSATLPQDGYNHIRVAPDGSFLIVFQNLGNVSGTAYHLAADTLTTIRTYVAEGLQNYFREIVISGDSREIVFQWGNWHYTDGHIIEALDAATGALLRLGFAQATRDYDTLTGFLPLPDNRVAQLFLDGIAILHPYNYAATAPVVLSGFCGGPFIDDFSDPNSGWPVADLGPVAYRYDNDNYSILQRESDRWSAVSRGDVWNNWERVGVRTWVPAGDGISGLVFGLNADWSEFYTFEVVPSVRRWIVFAYRAGTGWEMKANGTGANGPNEPTSLLLIQSEDGSLAMLVNDQIVYSLPSIPAGRIGLSGGSFEGQVDLRFDDYMVVTGPNCFDNNRRATGLERSPAISRPPLEELLK